MYVEPPRRVKEILEEELYFQKEACHVKHPAAGNLPYSKWQVFVRANINCFKELWQNCYFQKTAPNIYVIAWGTFRIRTTA